MIEIRKLDPADLIPMEMVPGIYPHIINASQLDWLLRNRNRNGFDRAVVVLSPRRRFLSKSRFEEWLASRADC